jgi:hypothetical protein
VEDRWYDANAEYFKVRSTDGKRYILRYDERADEWTLQSGFDGPELLARPNIELVTVAPDAIRAAELRIAGCERCSPDEADKLFDRKLADILEIPTELQWMDPLLTKTRTQHPIWAALISSQ